MSTVLYPVVVTQIKPTADPETFQVRLEQIFDKEVKTQSGLLSLTMEGHSKFNGSSQTNRVMFQSFSASKIKGLGIEVGTKLNDLPGIEKIKIVTTEALVPFWSRVNQSTGEMESQKPKTAGKDGEVLTFQGKPIYRQNSLAINNMSFEDVLIDHDNEIRGSSVVKAEEAKIEDEVGNLTI